MSNKQQITSADLSAALIPTNLRKQPLVSPSELRAHSFNELWVQQL